MGTKTQKLSNVVDQIIEWQSVFVGDGSTGLTAVAGRGYFIDTTSGSVTVTLPASPKIGDIVQLKDYARTWDTNAVTIASALFDGFSSTNTFNTRAQTITLVYMDGTKGWSLINEDTTTGLGEKFVTATGGTVTESGNFKIHSFTGDGCFVVSCAGNPGGSDTVDYLVVAGGGGGGSYHGGGGGAGGYRESSGTASGCYTASPLGACVSALPVSATTYPVTVGAGGVKAINSPICQVSTNGSNSVFSTITSAGGGSGGGYCGSVNRTGGSGGSGGGGNNSVPGLQCGAAGGTGNTPPVSPPQGNNGGSAGSDDAAFRGGGGGGGATSVGGDVTPTSPYDSPGNVGPGGNGATSSITGSPVTRAGGGGGGSTALGGTAGPGGGAQGNHNGTDDNNDATANTGGGGGGAGAPPCFSGGAGGKGIVIIRYKFQ